MTKFTIIDTGSRGNIKYFSEELKREKLIAGTEKDEHNDTVYHTHNIVAVNRIAEDYDGVMVDVVRER